MSQDIDQINKQITVARNFILLILLTLVLVTGLGFGAYYAYRTYVNYRVAQTANTIEKERANDAARKSAELQRVMEKLNEVKRIGDTADFGGMQMKLTEIKQLDTLPAVPAGTKDEQGRIRIISKPARIVVGLHFVVNNTSSFELTWNRDMGWLVTEDNPHQVVSPVPFNSDYLSKVGETYTFNNRDLLIRPNQERNGWIVVEIDQSISRPVFGYPFSNDLVGYWLIETK